LGLGQRALLAHKLQGLAAKLQGLACRLPQQRGVDPVGLAGSPRRVGGPWARAALGRALPLSEVLARLLGAVNLHLVEVQVLPPGQVELDVARSLALQLHHHRLAVHGSVEDSPVILPDLLPLLGVSG